jgi:hypothetical protein
VVEQVLPPGVQYRGHPNCGAEMLGIGGEGPRRLGRRLEQDVVDNRLVLQRDAGDRRRHREHQVEIRHRQQLGLAIGEPLRAGQTLALRTVPVAAGIVGDAGLAAIRIGKVNPLPVGCHPDRLGLQPYQAKRVVIVYDSLDRQLVVNRREELAHQHVEAAVARQRDHLPRAVERLDAVGLPERRSDGAIGERPDDALRSALPDPVG